MRERETNTESFVIISISISLSFSYPNFGLFHFGCCDKWLKSSIIFAALNEQKVSNSNDNDNNNSCTRLGALRH